MPAGDDTSVPTAATASFVDERLHVVVKNQANDSMEAALHVAAEKYRNQISITGTAQFREEAARRAARHCIMVRDADLWHIVEAEMSPIPNTVSE